MTTRTIPNGLPALMKLGNETLAGVLKRGDAVGVAQNTAPRIATDHYDLFGEPGENPANRGKQAALNAARDALHAARAARHAAMSAGRAFCAQAVDLFKGHLGRTWNVAWMAAGFTRFSIGVSRADVPSLLMEIRNYLRQNPGRENAPLEITAALADAKLTGAEAANAALNSALAARKRATAARDAAARKLRSRLSGLREELDRLLEDTDPLWHEFGFGRPVDGRRPEEVSELTATPGLPGQVLVQHAASARAIDYRVSWKLQGCSGEPSMSGLFADLAVPLSGLPSGVAIVVSVTARNHAGETPPAEVTIVVP